GEHAPGWTDPVAGLAALHHQHLAHALAASRLRAIGEDLHIRITLNLTNAVADDPSHPADLDAARRLDGLCNRSVPEPMPHGTCPSDVLADLHEYDFAQSVRPGDLQAICQPLDFLGVNHYHDDNFSAHPLPADPPAPLVPTAKEGRSWFVGSEFVTSPSRG